MGDQVVCGTENYGTCLAEGCAAHVRRPHARAFRAHRPLQRILSQAPRGLRPKAMEARAAKRLAQIQHVRAKPFFSDVSSVMAPPDPRDPDISASEWKRLVSAWVRALKDIHKQRSMPPEASAPEVMGGA